MPYAGTFRCSQRFGSNAAAYLRFNLAGHNGYDAALPVGTQLLACVSGTVTERQNDPTGYGQYAVITDTAGGQWLYGHASSWWVAKGQTVTEGQRIGASGNTGNSTGPHLHFGHRPAGYDRSNGYLGWVNPRPFLPLPYAVLIQAGHYPDGGGAPREAEWTWKLAQALSVKLGAAGVAVATLGDFYNKPPTERQAWFLAEDYDLFLALHYDAAVYEKTSGNSGCCIARGTYETEPWEADRFVAEWKRTYPKATGIPLHQERVNPNMLRYYALSHLTYVTPGVVVEHGVGAPGVGLDAPVLWDELERVAAADAAAVLAYLGVAAPAGEDEDVAQVADLQAKLAGLEGYASALRDQISALREEVQVRTEERDSARVTVDANVSEIASLHEDVEKPLRAEVASLKTAAVRLEARIAVMEEQVREAVALAGRVTAQRPARIELVYSDGRIGYLPEP